jgi:NAD(P)H-dependent flavin oxidoreductase YrpB (nitropropane dioxygenase family)
MRAAARAARLYSTAPRVALPGALAHPALRALPVIAAPLFIISVPKLVIAQCTAGVVGSVPALNARPAAQLDDWLAEITEALAAHDRAHPSNPAAPFAVIQCLHKSNIRLPSLQLLVRGVINYYCRQPSVIVIPSGQYTHNAPVVLQSRGGVQTTQSDEPKSKSNFFSALRAPVANAEV